MKLARFLARSVAAATFAFYVADPSASFTPPSCKATARQANFTPNDPTTNFSFMQFLTIRVIGVLIVLIACAAIPVAPIYAQTQTDMNAQARGEFVRADADLNKTYQAVLKKLPDAEGKQKLKEAQQAWVVSRDAEATRAADEVRGGSMAPTLRYETMTELTRQRIKQLETRLTSNAAPDEKNANTPSTTPTATSSASAQELDKEPAAAAPNPSSVSPDKKWEYQPNESAPKIVKPGTNEVALDLSDQPAGNGFSFATVI